MRPIVNPQIAMAMPQFFVQVFIAISIAALASAASSECHNRGYANSTDFKIICSPISSDFYRVLIICRRNDWTKWPDVKLHLSPGPKTKVYFKDCTFPSTVNVHSILNSMELPVIASTEFIYLKGMLSRKNLKGLSIPEFYLSDNNFQELPFDMMYDVMNVSSFVSYYNKLKNIPDSFFGDWAENLTQVGLHHNNLQKIKKSDFSQLVNLKNLNLGYNQITEIEPAAFDKLVNLQSIDLSFNRLHTVPVGICQRIITLDLAHNEITEIEPAAFDKLVNLESINLSFNRLRTLPVGIFQQTNTLNLANNEIAEIEPAAFDKLVNLESINLSSNRLRILPIGVFQRNIRLKSIDLSRNFFDELAHELLANSKLLENFSMDENNGTLSTLPKIFSEKLCSLQFVSVEDSQLNSLATNLFTGCSNVTWISLNENKLKTLPSGLFDDTRELRYLSISQNRLETLPPHIFSKLNRLEQLFLDTNRLTSLMSEMLEGLQSVLKFDASNNKITRIDDRFFHYLKSAHLIDLSHNQITFDGHQHGVKLQDMNESSLINTVTTPVLIDGSYIYARDLKLFRNNISVLNADVVKFLKYVHHLNLSHNRISQIDLSVLPVEDMKWNITLDGKVETRYKSIDLNWNPFHCDCNMKDFIQQLNWENGTAELRAKLPGFHTCASPPEMEDRYLPYISPDELNCPLNTSDPPRVQKIE